jgi:hypothetical protein
MYNKYKKNIYARLKTVGIFVFFFILTVSIFDALRGEKPYSAELSYIEYSRDSKNSGSIIPASCDSANPYSPFYTGPLGGQASSGSHFDGDCITACPAGSTGGSYDPYYNPDASRCSKSCPGGSVVSYAAACPPAPYACIQFDGACAPPPAAPAPAPAPGGGGSGGCFIAGTRVLMSDGTFKNIENVTYDESLMSSNGPEKVMKRYVIPYKGLVYAFNGDGNYFVTPTHPFMTTNGWKSLDPDGTRRESPGILVSKLATGDTLVLENNKTKKLTRLDSKEVSTTVYNFGINGTHDFYANDYLVHNVDLGLIDRAYAKIDLNSK